MPQALWPLVREALTGEARRLSGRPRRPSRRVSPAREATARTPAYPSWATLVLDHAEGVMRGDVALSNGRGSQMASPFEEQDLGRLPVAIAEVVRAHEPVPEDALVPLLVEELGISELPRNYERMLGRLVWSAKGRRMIALEGGAWVAGPAGDEPIAELDGRSLLELSELAGELAELDVTEDGVFLAMLAELVGEGERAPRIVTGAVGAAIALARRRGLLERGPRGQALLFDDEGRERGGRSAAES